MEEPKQLSVSELRKKFESNKSSAPSTTTTSRPLQSTVTQSVNKERPAFTGNSQSHETTTSETDITGLSVKERMKLFDKSKNKPEPQQSLPPKKTQPSATSTVNVNNNNNNENPVSALPQQLCNIEPITHVEVPVHENLCVPQQVEEPKVEEIPAPVQEEKVEEIPAPVQEEKVEEISAPVQEEIVEEKQETVQEPIQEIIEPVQEEKQVERIEKEEIPPVVQQPEIVVQEETKNPVLNKNAGFASEMNAMLARKGLGSTEGSPIKPEQPKNQGLGNSDSYTEALLTRPTNEARKKKAKLVFVDDEDF